MEEIESLRQTADKLTSEFGGGATKSINAWRSLARSAADKGLNNVAIDAWNQVRAGLVSTRGRQEKLADLHARRRIGALRCATDLSAGIAILREIADECTDADSQALKIDILTEIAGLQAAAGNLSEAAKTYFDVGNARVTTFGKDHPVTARAFADAGKRFQEVGETTKAIEARQLQIEALQDRASAPKRDRELADAHHAIAEMSLARGSKQDHERAHAHAYKALELRTVQYAKEHRVVIATLSALVAALIGLELWDEALPHARQLLELQIESGAERSQIEEATGWLQRVTEKLEK